MFLPFLLVCALIGALYLSVPALPVAHSGRGPQAVAVPVGPSLGGRLASASGRQQTGAPVQSTPSPRAPGIGLSR